MRSSRSAGTRGSVCSRPRSGSPSQRRAELVSLVDHIIVGLDDIQIILRSETKLTARATSVRVGKQVRLALDGPNADGATFQDPAPIKLIVRAHQAREALATATAKDLVDAAAEQGLTGNYLARLIRLSYLAPDIVSATLDGPDGYPHPPAPCPIG